MSEKRNIVLITLDSLRADHCSFMGYSRKTTPTIDKMAKNGLYFENAITSGVPTLPSMYGIYTSEFFLQDPSTAFLNYQNVLNQIKRMKTLPNSLRINGYHTIGISANGYISKLFGFNRGFDKFEEFLGSTPDSNQFLNNLLARIFGLKTAQGLRGLISNYTTLLKGSSLIIRWHDIYEDVLSFLENEINNVEKPFFLHIFLVDTHTPYEPYQEIWGSKFGNLFRNFYHVNYLQWKKAQHIRGKYAKAPNWITNSVINAYDDSIYSIDSFIKKLKNDLADYDPIFIVNSDHGEAFGEHGFFEHPTMMYEELIHVPLVFYNADVKGRVKKPVSLLNLLPTILNLTGIQEENPRSFLYEGDEWVISKVLEKSSKKIAVRMKDWKYISGHNNEEELYYLVEDPGEQNNLINQYPNLKKELRKIAKDDSDQKANSGIITKKVDRIKI